MTTKKLEFGEYIKMFTNPNVTILGGDNSDHWFTVDGIVCCVLSDYYDDNCYRLLNYGITLEHLRERNGTFWKELFTNGDVNHDLGSDNILTLEQVKRICHFMCGTIDTPPVTACGMVNYVIDILGQEDVDEDELIKIEDVVVFIQNSLVTIGMDDDDAFKIADKIADEVREDALETCGEKCSWNDIDIAFHRALLKAHNIEG